MPAGSEKSLSRVWAPNKGRQVDLYIDYFHILGGLLFHAGKVVFQGEEVGKVLPGQGSHLRFLYVSHIILTYLPHCCLKNLWQFTSPSEMF